MARLTKRTLHGWELAAPCAPGVPLAALARYENIGSAHQFRHLSELLQPQRADILNIAVLPFTHSALRNAHEVTNVLESQVTGFAPVMDSLAHSHKCHRPCQSNPYYNAQVSKRKHFFLENRKKFPLGVYKSKNDAL